MLPAKCSRVEQGMIEQMKEPISVNGDAKSGSGIRVETT